MSACPEARNTPQRWVLGTRLMSPRIPLGFDMKGGFGGKIDDPL